MTKVVSYQVAGHDEVLKITPKQETMMRKAGVWPRNMYGHFTNVSHGLHFDEPTFSDNEVAAGIEAGKLSATIALV